MTLQDYERATALYQQIKCLDARILELKDIMHNNTAVWRMEVRRSQSFSPTCIEHYGLLPKFLDEVLSKHLEERRKLIEELDKL